MKCTFSLLWAFLALLVLAIAAPDVIDIDNLAISSSLQPDAQEVSTLRTSSVQTIPQESSILGTSPTPASSQVSSEDISSEDGLLAELHGLTNTNTTLSTASSDDNDATTASGGQWPNLKDWYRVDVRLGEGATHAGTFQLERMYERIYSVLKSCKKGSTMDECSIRNAVWRDGDNNYRTDSTLYLEVEHSYFDPGFPGLPDLGYRMMARVYQKMTEVPRNCFTITKDKNGGFKDNSGGDRDLHFCTVPSRALIVYPTNGGPVQMVLKVKLEWDHKTSSQNYECKRFSDSGVAEYGTVPFRNGFNQEIAKLHGWRADRVTTFVDCSIDKCFYTDPKRDNMEWQEQRDCKPRSNPRGCDKLEGGPKAEYYCPPEYAGW
ncbi:hypothetical protein J4E91_003415 [Alternaria rosae]|nr:hypothetical protein J4E91_003415 [Alternaria rosae]